MKTVNVHEAKTHLSRLLESVAEGEEIIIARAGKPVAKLVPADDEPPALFGFLKGSVIVKDDIIEPVDVTWDADG